MNLRDAFRFGAGGGRLRRVLQPPPLPRGCRQRHPGRRLLRPERSDPGQEEGGQAENTGATRGVPSGSEGARQRPKCPLEIGPKSPDYADDVQASYLDRGSIKETIDVLNELCYLI